MEEVNKFFCIQPFVNTTTRVRGQTNVCCNIVNSDSNIDTESPADFFNSEYVAQFRQDMLDGKKIDACRLCHYQESQSQNSHRIEYNNYYNIKDSQDIDYYKNIVDRLKISQLTTPLYAEIHVSNLCNLKCLTCNELDSSRFHAENKVLGVSQNPNNNFSTFDHKKIQALNSIIADKLLFLDIRGGETFMVPEVKKILLEVSPSVAKNITLKIQTNGTIVPDDEWCSIFKKFKRTKVNVSVDAYGPDINYIRYPADWSKILETIDVLQREDVRFIINTVVSNLNIMILDKLFKWIQDNKYLNYFYILDWPTHHRPNNLPKSLLDKAKQRLQNVEDNFVNKNCYKKVIDLMKMLDTQDVESNWQKFCKEIEMRDKHRKNSITTIIPQLKEYINGEIQRDQ